MSQTAGTPPPSGGQPDKAPRLQVVLPPAPTEAPEPSGMPSQPTVPNTRTGVVWWALGFSMLLLIVVLVFVLQNLSAASTTFFSVRWTIPLGLDLLLAALFGGLIVFLLGGARMLQLRRLVRRYGRPRKRG